LECELASGYLTPFTYQFKNFQTKKPKFIHSLFVKRFVVPFHGGLRGGKERGGRGGGPQIVYVLDVGKGEIRFCGFLGLDAFHTEIVWCVPLQIIRGLLLRVLQKKGNPKNQRSKESCIPTQHTTPHHTTLGYHPSGEMQSSSYLWIWFPNFLGSFSACGSEMRGGGTKYIFINRITCPPFFTLSNFTHTFINYYEWMVSVQPNIYSQMGNSKC